MRFAKKEIKMAGKSLEEGFHIGQSSYAPDGRSYSSVSFDLMLQQYQEAMDRADLSEQQKEAITKNRLQIMVKKITKSLGISVKKIKKFLQNNDKTKLSSL